LDASLLAALTQHRNRIASPAARVHTLAYVSCGFAALRRDAAALRAGGWTLASARAFAFFPGTDALETLAIFVRDTAAAEDDAADAEVGQAAAGARKPAPRRRARQARRAAAREADAAAAPWAARVLALQTTTLETNE
jgi:hypothetical protein